MPPSTTTTTIQGNQPPVANAGDSGNVSVGELSLYDGSNSFDPDGTIVSYAWDFGDGSTAAGPIVSHSYAQVGTYTVVLVVTDDGGLTDVDAIIINVE